MRFKLFVFIALIFADTIAVAQLRRFSFTQPKMGSPFNIVFYTNDSARAEILADNCFKLVDSFNLIFSDYIDSSQLSLLSKSAGSGESIPVSPALWNMLTSSKVANQLSKGAFDITIGPLTKLWRGMRKAKQFPADSLVASAKKRVGFKNLLLDTNLKTAMLKQEGMRLDLGGIAQGWIGDRVLQYLTANNISSALVNVSGDIVMSNAPPGKAGWTIGVNVPETKDELLDKTLLMQLKAVSTSGDAYQYTDYNGKRYSHIIDPRTGYGVTSQRNVTVIANDCTTADWLATACSILPINAAKKLAAGLGAEVLIAMVRKGRLVLYQTKGFNKYWKPEKK